MAGPGGPLLTGVDLKKGSRILETASNDREGVTAAFNLNVLARINRALGAEFATECSYKDGRDEIARLAAHRMDH